MREGASHPDTGLWVLNRQGAFTITYSTKNRSGGAQGSSSGLQHTVPGGQMTDPHTSVVHAPVCTTLTPAAAAVQAFW
jgi:hypothetical protein